MANEWIIWLIVGAIFLAAEVFTPGFFLLWFGVGAMAVGLLSLLGIGGPEAHIVLFLVVSVSLLIASRTILARLLAPRRGGELLASGIETMIGKVGLVVEPSQGPLSSGAVKVHGSVWTAYPAEGEWPLHEGDSVIVERIDGNAIYVRRSVHHARSFTETTQSELE